MTYEERLALAKVLADARIQLRPFRQSDDKAVAVKAGKITAVLNSNLFELQKGR